MKSQKLNDESLEKLINLNKGRGYREFANEIKKSNLDSLLHSFVDASHGDPFREFVEQNQSSFVSEKSHNDEIMFKNFNRLLKWTENNKANWPKQLPPKRRLENDPDIIEENSLAIWLYNVRKKYKIKKLSYYWVNEFEKIGYNLDPEFEKLLNRNIKD